MLQQQEKDEIKNAEIEFDYMTIEKQKEKIEKYYNRNNEQIQELEEYFKNFNFLKPIGSFKNKLETQIKLDIYTKLLNNATILYEKLRAKGEIRITQNILKNKLSIENLGVIQKSFPCIIGSLRDYANIIPFVENSFDLVIIDEASQVSIAQALPSLIRGKKVLIFGDKEQFSNVKSSMAARDKSNEYMEKIRKATRNKDEKIQEKVKIFNIRNSVLDFIENNKPDFTIKLNTHFRGYAELISFSNKYFYQNLLQTLKIRKKPLSEIIKFEIIEEQNNGIKVDKNINEGECDFIIKKINEYVDEFKNKDQWKSIGIITPYADQLNYLMDEINARFGVETIKMAKIKIMTFDGCQGEERDIVFYSMVATKDNDKLKYIFAKNINKNDEDGEEKIRLQRLNVGFSRVKELAYFVLSKDIDEFQGTARIALEHFYNESIKQDTFLEKTDKRSPMEEKIKNYIENTPFYRNKTPFLRCQFPIGDYLRQIDRRYKHPSYVVDFLLTVKNIDIVIEYDGFDFHFDEETNKYNYAFNLKEEDIIRQNILESYGYNFIRLNKFNLDKKDPIGYIDKLLYDVYNSIVAIN
jgi:hypothetical protein